MHKNHVQAPTLAGRTTIFSRTHSLLRHTLVLALLAIASICAQAQVTTELGQPISGLYNEDLTATATEATAVSVVLNDLEDHSWSYYTDATLPNLHSLNPADIKITYLGNGTGTVTAASATEAGENPTSFSRNASGVQVGPGATANRFVYFKTLERENADGTGKLKYTTIPNPFQVRPEGNTGNVTITPDTRVVYVSGTSRGNSGSIQVSYKDANNVTKTWSSSGNGTTANTTITVKAGTTITLTAIGRSGTFRYNYSTITAKYDDNNGSQIATVTTTTNNYSNGASSSGTVSATPTSVSCSKYRGFYAWRINSKSSSLTVTDVDGNSFPNNIIPANTEVRFTTTSTNNDDYITFEALWAQAYVVTTNTSTGLYANTYERNFVYLSSNTTLQNAALDVPVTYTTLEPSSGSGTKRTITIRDGFTCAADTKFENLTLAQYGSNDQTINANRFNLTIGRGVTVTNYISMIQGVQNSANRTAQSYGQTSYTITIESGTFKSFYLTGSSYSNLYNIVFTSTLSAKCVFGCDYDRARNDNTKLSISPSSNKGEVYGGGGIRFTNAANRNNLSLDWYIKSGKIQDNILGSADGGTESIYVGSSHYSGDDYDLRYYGRRRITVEGGELASIAGGVDDITTGKDYLPNDGSWTMMIRMKGGTVNGSIYGAAAYSGAAGDRLFIFTGGTIGGWIAGGANGTETDGGKLSGNTAIYFGGNAKCNSNGSNTEIGPGKATGGNIFGAGSGNANAGNNATVGEVNQSIVVIADNSEVERNVYGGGNYGYVAGTGSTNKSDMYLLGGTVNGSVFGGSNMQKGNIVNYTVKGGTVKGGIYGGSNQRGSLSGGVTMNISGGTIEQGVYGGGFGTNSNSCDVSGNVNITMTGGTVLKGLYGGGNVNSKINEKTTVSVNGGTIGSSEATASVYGGGLGSLTRAKNDVEVNIGNSGTGATIWGDVYGGSAQGKTNCNDNGDAQNGSAKTDVTVKAGTVKGKVFGGGLGIEGGVSADVWGPITVTMTGGNVNTGLYGGGNARCIAQKSTTVTVNGGNVGLEDTPANIHGGGYGQQTDVKGNVTVTLGECSAQSGATIYGEVYGGSALGSVNTSSSNKTTVTLNAGTVYGAIYGGALGQTTPTSIAAPVKGQVEVVVTGGSVLTTTADPDGEAGSGSVFGCNNVNGTPASTVKVDVYNTAAAPQGHVFALHAVYGGGNKSAYTGTPQVSVHGCGNSIEFVYGGGNAADVAGTDVTIWGADTIGNVFGGGNGYSVTENHNNPNAEHYNPGANITSGGTNVKIYGGTIGSVFGGSNQYGTINGGINVSVDPNSENGTDPCDNTLSSCDLKVHEVYGGGNEAPIKTSSGEWIVPTVTWTCDAVIGTLFGGAKKADYGRDIELTIDKGKFTNVFGGNNLGGTINGNVTVNMTGGQVGNLYGGCNEDGTINGTIIVNVDSAATQPCDYDFKVTNVYGGGNLAAYSSPLDNNNKHTNYPQVNIKSGTVSGSVFGGGKGDEDATGEQDGVRGSVTGNPVVTIGDATDGYKATVKGNVYGGGEAADVDGNTWIKFQKANNSAAKLFGGGKAANVTGTATVDLSAGKVTAGVYGGCDDQGTVGGKITVSLTGGTIGTGSISGSTISYTSKANVHGGGYGNNTSTTGDVEVNINGANVVVWGDVYGGSGYGNVNYDNTNTTTVNILNGTLNGNVYGGGLGDKAVEGDNTHHNYPAAVNGVVTVNIGAVDNSGQSPAYSGNATINGSVYGCNNTNGSPKAAVTVNIYKTATSGKSLASYTQNDATYAIDQVFGGGNQADYSPTSTDSRATVHVYTCDNTIRRVFGGGNAAAAYGVVTRIDGGRFDYIFGGGNGQSSPANIGAGGTNLTVNGGFINYLFGGSNEQGTINGTMGVAVYNTAECGEVIKNFFAGGNRAVIGAEGENNGVDLNTTIACGTNFGSVYGGSKLAAIYGNLTMTIKGGTITNAFGGSQGDANTPANITGNVTLNLYGGTITNAYGGSDINGNITGKITVNVLDYQDNECPLSVTNIYGAGNWTAYNPNQVNNQVISSPEVNVMHIKSGNSISGSVYGGGKGDADHNALVAANPVVNIGYTSSMSGLIPENYLTAAGLSSTNDLLATVSGNVFGGGDAAQVAGTTTINLQKANSSVSSIFGGGNMASVGNTVVNVIAGSVSTGIYGGCNTSGTVGGPINNVTYDGTILVNIKSNLGASGTPLTEGIYGGGKGSDTQTTGNITVTIGDGTNPTIYSDIYGGSALGQVGATGKIAKIDFKNGTLQGVIYGGGMGDANNAATVSGGTEVVVSSGSISGGIYGGCNANGNVVGDITVSIATGTIGTSTSARANVHGGGYGAATTTQGAVTVNIASNGTATGPTIYGDIYGGSGFGQVSASNLLTQVNFYKGTINGDIYGGGLGDSNNPAEVSGNVEVNISGGVFNSATGVAGGGQIFGCNNANGTPKGDVAVNIYGTDHGEGIANNQYPTIPTGGWNATTLATNTTSQKYAISAVYGGGNKAAYIPVAVASPGTPHGTTVHVYTCDNTIEVVYGGGNAADVGSTGTGAIKANTNVIIEGGRINQVFGGGNGAGDGNPGANIYGTASTTLYAGVINQVFGGSNEKGSISATNFVLGHDDDNNCAMFYGEVFGGGNLAPITGNLTTTIECGAGKLGNFYGGANQANITGNVTLNIFGGEYDNVFGGSKGVAGTPADITGNVTLNLYGGTMTNAYGGSDVNGNITGQITVNVLDYQSGTCSLSVQNIYGAGNWTAYDPNEVDNEVISSPVVNVMHIKSGNSILNVYGGGKGDADHDAIVKANPIVNIGYDANTMSSLIPQGYLGNSGVLSSADNLIATVTNNVYGGGDAASVEGNTTVKIQKSNTTVGNAFGGGNAAVITGTTTLTMTNGTVSNLYGGGNQAGVTSTATVNMNGGTVSTGIYGGCNSSGSVNGVVSVNVNGGTVGTSTSSRAYGVFGGGYGSGTATGNNVIVTIGNDANLTPTVYGDVYGGSAKGNVNSATANPANLTKVELKKGTVYGDIYGGGFGDEGANALVNGNVQVVVNGGTVNSINNSTGGRVFGCNNLNGAPQGTVQVNYTAGTASSVFGGGNQAAYAGTPDVNISGGNINNVYGGGNEAGVAGGNVTISGGTITTGVYGGCNTSGTVGGTINNATYEGTILVNIKSNLGASGTPLTEGIYGGGKGSATQTTGNITVTIGDGTNPTIYSNIYGGSALGQVGATGKTAKIDFKNGTLNGNIYGGGMGQTSPASIAAAVSGGTEVAIGGGNINGSVYGGCNENGSVTEDILVNLTGGTIGTSGGTTNIVFGGGYGASTSTAGNVTVTVNGATIHGHMYGGSALGSINDAAADKTTVNILAGTVNGNIFGGGLGEAGNANKGQVNGTVIVNIGAGTVNQETGLATSTSGTATINGSVYGCNNTNGSPKANVTVNVYKAATSGSSAANYAGANPTYAISQIFGGGRNAAYLPTVVSGTPYCATVHVYTCDNTVETIYGGGDAANATDVKVIIDGGRFDRVFGGGNGYSATNNHNDPSAANYNPGANISGSATTQIRGGHFRQVFGGSNQYGDVANASLSIDPEAGSGCGLYIDESFGGANEAEITGNVTTTLACTGNSTATIGSFYGGSNMADITGNVTLNVFGGTYTNVFGGSKGVADDPSTEIVNEASPANITGDVTLNLYGGTMDNAFGGSDANGNINGKITVNVLNNGGDCDLEVHNIYGGGRDAAYHPTTSGAYPEVNLIHGTVSKKAGGDGKDGNVFGGGLGATAIVYSNPKVNIGYNAATMSSLIPANANTNNYVVIIQGDVYGGGDAGNVDGTPQVNVYNRSNTSIGNVYGGGNAADVNGTDVNIDGGTITGMVFGGGHGDKTTEPQKEANVNGHVTVDVTGGTINKVFGGSNSKGNITGNVAVNIAKGANSGQMHITEVYGGGNEAAGNAGTITIGCTGDEANNEGIGTVYGGANAANVNNGINLTINGGHIDNVYGGNNTSGSISGTVTVNVNWDDNLDCDKYLGNVYGGGNLAALIGAATVNIQKGTVSQNVFGGGNQAGVGTATVNMIGGSVLGGLYGGCNTSGTVGGAVSVSLTGGTIGTTNNRADVFGGGLGSATATSGNIGVTLNGTTVYGDLYGGSAMGSVNASTQNTTTLAINSNTLHGTIYGGGKGSNEGNGTTAVTNGIVIIDYNTANTGLTGLYGGANVNGSVAGNILVNVKDNVGADGNNIDIYGGGLGDATATSGNVTVTIGDLTLNGNNPVYNPVIYGAVYGGSALGQVNATGSTTTVNVLSGTLHGNVYGGGRGEAGDATKGQVNGTVIVNIGSLDNSVYSGYATIDGSVYGCNNTNGSPKANVTVNIYKTAHDAKNLASYTESDATYAIDQVFGGGNQADYSPTSTDSRATVHVYTCDNTIRRVFGGGNAAAAYGVVTTIDGGRFDYIFGGGNGEGGHAANIDAGGTNLTVNSGVINYLFGGSNETGSINGPMRVAVNNTGCTEDIKNFFAGGNLAVIGAEGSPVNLSTTIACGTVFDAVYGGSNLADIYGNVTMTINGGTIGEVYAGSKGRAADQANNIDAKAANIYGNTVLNIYGGDIGDAFGGSNINGNISGTITVNMDWSQAPSGCNSESDLHINNIFGASNLATYTPTTPGDYPAVNIKHGTVSGSVFGAGNGVRNDATKGIVTSNPVVTIGDNVAGHYAVVAENVYGGGNNAAVSGSTQVIYNDNNANSTVARLFGGGNAANVSGTTTVTLTNGKVTGGVYGGCNTTGSVGAVTVALNGGQVGASGAGNEASVFGGGYGPETTTTGDISVTLGNTTVYGDIYGGSALGKVNSSSASPANLTTVTINGTNLNGSVFGGGKGDDNTQAVSYGNATVNINAANTYTGIYGGADVNGLVSGNIELNINANVGTSSSTRDIFGGGYGALTQTGGNVTVNVGDGNNTPIIYGAIYGGSALGSVNDAEADITTVNVKSGNITGNIYGGGLGEAGVDNIEKGQVNGTVVVNIGSGTVDQNTGFATSTSGSATINGSVYGCNNTNGSPKGNVTVNIYQTAHTTTNAANYTGDDATYAIENVFGGGRNANYSPTSGDSRATVHVYTCNNTIEDLFGGGDAAAALGVVTIVDGGRFDRVFGGGNGESTAADIGAGGTNLQIHGGKINTLFGGSNTSGTITGEMRVNIDAQGPCGQDMDIVEFFCGNNLADIGTAQDPVTINATIGCDTKFGSVYGGCNLAKIYGNVNLTIVGGEMEYVFGGSKGSNSQAADITGNVHLIIKGGDIDNVFGGSNINGNIEGSITVDIDKDNPDPCVWDIGNVYGASNLAAYTPNDDSEGNKYPQVNIKNGTVGGDVFGGGYGASARATSNPQVNLIGGTVNGHIFGGGAQAPVTGSPVVTASYGSVTNVYGGGLGSTAIVIGNPSVVINQTQGKSLALTDVFGGGDAAEVTGSTTVTLTAGTVTRAFGGGNKAAISASTTVNAQGATIANIYGGGNEAGAEQTNVNVSGGSVTTGVYGGSNSEGTITGAIAVSITGGTIGTDATHTANVHGGGYGASTASNGNVSVTINGNNVNIWGDVYGGSALGNVNGTSNTTTVTLEHGTIHGSLYGGGLGDASHAALVNGNVNVIVNGGTVTDKVFGANNVNGTPKGAVTVTINGTDTPAQGSYALAEVYGGGNQANYNPTNVTPATVVVNGCDNSIGVVYGGGNAADVLGTDVTIWGGTIGKVFGGGHGNKDANPATEANVVKRGNDGGNVAVKIYGGTIGEVFGGSNSKGTIQGTSTVTIEDNGGSCTFAVNDVYGGGNQADGNAGTLNIGCGAVITGNVYGGAKQANVNDNIHLVISGGNLHNVFGGNNISGTISGTITVDIDKDDSCNKTWKVDNVYGGGNLAAYTAPQATPDYPVVNIKNGTVTGNVFGGGFGESAEATGNPHVNLIGGVVNGYIFGGGDAAAVTGNTTVTLTTGSANRAFGGGNQAAVSGSTTVNAQGATIANIYGGGNEAGAAQTNVNVSGGSVTSGVYGGSNSEGTITGAIAVSITGGTIGTDATHTANVHGGGYGASTASNGNVSVTINGSGVNIWGDVYGGSALGNVNDDTSDLTAVTLTAGTIHGSLYGGGLGDANNAALVNGNVNVIVNGGTVTDKVFGANNVNGTPKGAVTVTINGTDQPQSGYALAEVYGGGNQAHYLPTATTTPATVVVNGCDNKIGVVYGGGNAANVPATDVTIWGGTIGQVFGGGHGNKNANPPTEANVTGNVAVKIYGGTITEVFGGSNSKGNITGTSTVTIQEHQNSTCEMSITDVYGGGNQAAGNAGTLNIGCGAVITGNVYGGAKEANVNNNIHLLITGGNLNNVFGGNNVGGSIAGTITVDINQDNSCDTWHVNNVYGGGNLAAYTAPQATPDYPVVNIMNGTISGNVFGGGLGSSAVVTANPHVNVTGGTILGNLYGGGDAASVDGSTYIAVLGGTIGASNNHSNIHGGGYGQYTNVSGDVTVNIGSVSGSGNQAVYSGAAMIYGDVYGGSALGTVNTNHSGGGDYEKTAVNLYGGTIDGNVYGGGLGSSSVAALVYGDVGVFLYGAALKASYDQFGLPSSGMIFGCNNINGTPKGKVTVAVYGTTDLDGQGRSTAEQRATHNEADHHYELAAVYGGGNRAAYDPDDSNGTTLVIIDGCGDISIHSVYGGGNAASAPATDVRIVGAYEIEYVFGGGNGAGMIDGNPNPGANVGYYAYPESIAGPDQVEERLASIYKYGTGVAKTEIYGGRIHKVFGGSNTRGNVREATVAMLDEVSDCELTLDGIYGGGKSAYMEGNAEIELGCIHGLDEIYGGAEQADVGSNIVLTLTSGVYNKVYGGNNLGGKIMGSITVNIEQTGCLPIEIGELYLGGNNAPYSVYGYNANGTIIESADHNIYDHPVMNLRSFKSIGTVFGGGEGSGATLAGNPTINVNVANGWVDGQYKGTGDNDPNHIYHAKPQVLTDENEDPADGVIGQIFGGGNAAKVIGSTTINIGTQTSVEMESLKALKAKIKANNGTLIMGGMKFELSQDENSIIYTVQGQQNSTMTKTIIQTVNGATISGNVYGGGNQADVTGSTNITVGKEEGEQQQQGGGSGAPRRNQEPAQSDEPQQPQQPQNAATQSDQTRNATLTRQ